MHLVSDEFRTAANRRKVGSFRIEECIDAGVAEAIGIEPSQLLLEIMHAMRDFDVGD